MEWKMPFGFSRVLLWGLLLCGGVEALGGSIPAYSGSLLDRLGYWADFAETWGDSAYSGGVVPGEWTIYVRWYPGGSPEVLASGEGSSFSFSGMTGSWWYVTLKHRYYSTNCGWVSAFFSIPGDAVIEPQRLRVGQTSEVYGVQGMWTRVWVATGGVTVAEMWVGPSGGPTNFSWEVEGGPDDVVVQGVEVYAYEAGRDMLQYVAGQSWEGTFESLSGGGGWSVGYGGGGVGGGGPVPSSLPVEYGDRWYRPDGYGVPTSGVGSVVVGSNWVFVGGGGVWGAAPSGVSGGGGGDLDWSFDGLTVGKMDVRWDEEIGPRSALSVPLGWFGTWELGLPSGSLSWVRQFLRWCIRVGLLLAMVRR